MASIFHKTKFKTKPYKLYLNTNVIDLWKTGIGSVKIMSDIWIKYFFAYNIILITGESVDKVIQF